MKKLISAIVVALLFTVANSVVQAANEQAVALATKAADSWLNLLGEGKYAQSWKETSSLFRDHVTEQAWETQAGATLKPLGKLESRKLRGAQYLTQVPGAPDGQYVVITYDSSFQNKKSAVETVTPMLDRDGRWRVSGYFIR